MNLNEKTKVLITGCGGMLGEAVYDVFSKKCNVLATDIDVNEEWLQYLDVRDINSIFKKAVEFKPDLLINLAAITDLEDCEKNQSNAYITNALGQENMCLVAQKLDVPLVYISTAGIFDGKKEFYNDFDSPNPLSIYGKSKYYGEVAAQRLKKSFIFRAGWMMGGGNKDKKFIRKILIQIKEGKNEIFVVDDKAGTPTYTMDFASNMIKVIETGLYGLYNMVCEGSGSRYDVALEILKCLKVDDKIKLTKVSSDYFQKEYFAPRPPSEKLVNLKLSKRGLLFMRDWKICLREYLKRLK